MYFKTSNFIICLVLAAVLGFGISFLCVSNGSQGNCLGRDIAEAPLFSDVKEESEDTVIVEKQKPALEDLTDRTIDTCQSSPELQSVLDNRLSLEKTVVSAADSSFDIGSIPENDAPVRRPDNSYRGK